MSSRSLVHGHRLRLLAVALVAVLGLSACSTGSTGGSTQTEQPKKSDLVLASTTSTQDSGLFDVLIPAFEKDNPKYKVKVIAVGTGEALKLGEKKDADVLLVHAKKKEEAFVASGFGEYRKDVMYNDFVVVGPNADPAKVKGMTDAAAAFKKIADAKATFVSRGDDSGTHTKEQSIWASATVDPAGSWYLKTGQGMGETLRVASEKQGYTLADRGTYLAQKSGLDLVILVEGAKALLNQYGVIPVVGAKNPDGAHAFADWITSEKGQKVIEAYGKDKFGVSLFIPNAK